jgi:hypothetical protein
MSPEAHREHSSCLHLSSPLLRNVIMAVLASISLTSGAKEALSAPKDQQQLNTPLKSKNPSKPDKSKITEEQQRCGLTGTLKLSGKSVMLQAVCIQGKQLSIGEVLLLHDKSGHFNIPRTNAYFFLSDDGEPALSFIKNGERVTGMMKCENGTCSFDQYLEFIE